MSGFKHFHKTDIFFRPGGIDIALSDVIEHFKRIFSFFWTKKCFHEDNLLAPQTLPVTSKMSTAWLRLARIGI